MSLAVIQKAKRKKRCSRAAKLLVGVFLSIFMMVLAVNLDPAEPVKSAIELDVSEIPFEFGDTNTFTRDEPPYFSSVVYPSTGMGDIDKAISKFALDADEEAYNQWKSRCEEAGAQLKGAYSLRCRTYLVSDGLGVIEAIGNYNDETGARPFDTVSIFNIDLNNSRLLNLAEIFDLTQEKKLLGIFEKRINEAYPGAQAKLSLKDLDKIAILPQGARLDLGRGECVPTEYGPIQIDASYAELSDLVIVSAETVKKRDYSHISKDAKMVALTFDDGPCEYTEQVLGILNKYGGRATFCVVGSRVSSYKETLGLIDKSGSQIMGHSWDHSNLSRMGREAIRQNLLKTNMAIYKATGKMPRYYRPPYGAVNERVKDVSKDLGMSIVNWNVDTEDWKSRDAVSVAARSLDGLRSGSIILYHDLYPSTIEAMRKVIPELVRQGYELVTVDELLTVRHGDPQAGALYYH
jgi:peptidoglycan/xylan/chitin deacetylase (PgdA/CDA1 family)